MCGNPSGGVQLPADQLARARALRTVAAEALSELGRLVSGALERTAPEQNQFQQVTLELAPSPVQADDDSVIPMQPGCWTWHDLAGGCAVYCDPPGTCAPCTAEPTVLLPERATP